MNYKFKTLTLHNFLSFGDATIDLTDKGYCLICGKNNNPSDRALSNGSGKSTIISGISYCLTGQTIQGIKSNIVNKFTSGGCFVSLDFNVDNDNYIITRYKDHEKYKTDLKIFKNGEDISGKGIQESSKLLAQYLPELTPQLISSVILLGQGLPNSFTKNSPSGRKELLEQLTGSDFMIQDVKNRLNERIEELNNDKRKFEDNILSLNTQIDIHNSNKVRLTNEISNWVIPDYDKEIGDIVSKINEDNALIEINVSQKNALSKEIIDCNELIKSNEKNKYDAINKINDEYKLPTTYISNQINNINSEIYVKKKQKQDIDNIKEFCPTCKQRIIGVVKPDTTHLSNEIVELESNVMKLNEELTNINNEWKKKVNDIETQYNNVNSNNEKILVEMTRNNRELENKISAINLEISSLNSKKTKLEQDKLYNTQNYNNKVNELNELNNTLKQLNDNLLYNNNELENIKQHCEYVTKMNTLVKRDFRGYLLKNIITYLENKSKEYCKYIFNTNDLQIQLNGNDIDILFQSKEFESLSGGEKQKLDVIIQFAIRDMMSNYLDFSSNILFLDEITDNLDSVGCDGLFNLISSTLNDLESIFIISHHQDELVLPLDNTILVEKNNVGISRVIL